PCRRAAARAWDRLDLASEHRILLTRALLWRQPRRPLSPCAQPTPGEPARWRAPAYANPQALERQRASQSCARGARPALARPSTPDQRVGASGRLRGLAYRPTAIARATYCAMQL